MNFQESIKTCFSKYATFDGRASLPEYWWFSLFLFCGNLILSFVSPKLGGLFGLVTLLPSLAVGARRLHDTNRSGWLQLLWLIPVIGWIIMLVFQVQDAKEPNRFGTAAAVPVTNQSL